MSEEEILEMILDERINAILKNVKYEKNEEQQKKILEAETIIDTLPTEHKALIEHYCNNIMNIFTIGQTELYKQGFIDGVRTIKKLMDL